MAVLGWIPIPNAKTGRFVPTESARMFAFPKLAPAWVILAEAKAMVVAVR